MLDHIPRIYNQISYWNIWFAKVIIILVMTTWVIFFDFCFKKTHKWMPLSSSLTETLNMFQLFFRNMNFNLKNTWGMRYHIQFIVQILFWTIHARRITKVQRFSLCLCLSLSFSLSSLSLPLSLSLSLSGDCQLSKTKF